MKHVAFDGNKSELSFNMPFNWNLSRIKNVKIFVHEEVSFPKPSQLASKCGYLGEVNGIGISAKQLMVDPTNPSKDVVHFMLPKETLVNLAEQVNNNTTTQASISNMNFSLKSASGHTSTNQSSDACR